MFHATKNKILIHYHISLLASFVGNSLEVSNRFKHVDFCQHILWHRVNFTFFGFFYRYFSRILICPLNNTCTFEESIILDLHQCATRINAAKNAPPIENYSWSLSNFVHFLSSLTLCFFLSFSLWWRFLYDSVNPSEE